MAFKFKFEVGDRVRSKHYSGIVKRRFFNIFDEPCYELTITGKKKFLKGLKPRVAFKESELT